MKEAQLNERSPAMTVFGAIADRYCKRADEITRFASTRYSFEEWLNWEAYSACSVCPGLEVLPKPNYRKLGADGGKDIGDLLVTSGASRVLVEIGLVHDGTSDKWLFKLARDVEKLARPLPGILKLQMIVLVSRSQIEASEVWQTWLGKLECWNRATDMTVAAALPPSGAMIIRGWSE
jgi:hypothetical protein